MATRSAAAACLAALLLCSMVLGATAEAATQAGDTPAGSGGEVPAAAESGAAAASTLKQQRPPFIVLRHQDSWVLEGAAIAFLLAFLVNMLIGRRRNEKLALAWTAEVRGQRVVGPVCKRERLPPARRMLPGPGHCVERDAAAAGTPSCVWYRLVLTPTRRLAQVQMVAQDGVLDRNFALLGPGDTEVRCRAARCVPRCVVYAAPGLCPLTPPH